MRSSRCRLLVSLASSVLAVGCKAEPYAEIRSACGPDGEDFVPLVWGEDSYYSVSEACSTAVGDIVGLDWSSFGDSPTSFDYPETAAQVIVSSVVNLVGSDHGSTRDLREVNSFLNLEAFDNFSSQASRFWLDMFTESVEKVEYVESDRRAYARYWAFGDSILVYSSFTDDIDDGAFQAWIPPVTAALLVHESSHKWTTHTECYQQQCWDADASGAYGVEATYLYSWLGENSQVVTSAECRLVASSLELACWSIDDHAGFAPCEDPYSWCPSQE